ncbi:ParB/RepB/Spo0J family partition protein [Enterovibrio norvegicus]|uniref:ParB/RepB/Spo0J family partition protein n=1 Tax=Enterovibrio norvegicus TaxID=188144 RepID=UPI00352CDA99
MTERKIKALGRDRQIEAAKAKPLSSSSASGAYERAKLVWRMASGNDAEFYEEFLDFETLSDPEKCYVEQEVNGRNQELNHTVARQLLTQSLKKNQYYPIIVKKHHDGRYEVLDGSRRTMSAIELRKGLRAFVTTANVLGTDAKALARDIQNNGKELSLYEFGEELLRVKLSECMNQKQLAVHYSTSERKISDAIKAAEVPASIVGLFSSVNDISIPEFKALHKLCYSIGDEERANSISKIANDVRAEVIAYTNECSIYPESIVILRMLERAFEANVLLPVKAEKPKPVSLKDFDDVKKYARFVRSDRKVTIELSRINPAKIDAILESIKKELD